MTPKRYKDIYAFQTATGEVVGFHARNLEVAELTSDAWQALGQSETSEALNELKEWNEQENENAKSGHIEMGIRSLTLNVTQICNLHCTYCAAGGDGTYGDPVKKIAIEKTLPQLKYFLDKTPNQSVFAVNFLGGEPLLYPDTIRAIVEYGNSLVAGRSVKLKWAVTTNGTMITDNAVELLTQHRFHVAVSLDGPAEVNDRARITKSGEGSTVQVVEGIRKLAAVKKQLGSLGISAVFDRHNMEIEKAFDFFSELGVHYYEFNFSHTEVDQNASDAFIAQMQNIAAKAYAKGGEAELRKIKAFDHYFDQLDNQQRVENFCGSGKSFLMIDARNNLYTCPWVVGEKTEIVGSGTLVNESKLKAEYEKSLIEANNCSTCWARYVCGGGCMFVHRNKTGNKHEKDNNFCTRTQNLIQTAIMYYVDSRKVANETH